MELAPCKNNSRLYLHSTFRTKSAFFLPYYITEAIGAVFTSNVEATGPFTLYTGFPQLVGWDEIWPQIVSDNPDGQFERDPTRQQLADFYDRLAETYQLDETDSQPWAKLHDPNRDLLLLPIRDREFTARINPDQSITDYSYRIERILPGDQITTTYRTVTPYDAFLYSLNRLCNLSKRTEQDAVPISQQMSFEDIIKGCNGAFDQQTGGSGFPYRLRSWNRGYAPPQGADGGKMKLFYRFEYVPDVEAGFSADRSPAIMIWVQGQYEKEGCS